MSKRKQNLIDNKDSMTNLIRKAFLREGYTKRSEVYKILKCDWSTLKQHIESQFDEDMTWENRGRYGWHVDHIIPLYYGKNKKELIKLNHYTNLKPMWWYNNLSKNRNIVITELTDSHILRYTNILTSKL